MRRAMKPVFAIVAAMAVFSLLLAACGDSDDDNGNGGATPGTTTGAGAQTPAGTAGAGTPAAGGGEAQAIDVKLQEFAVLPAQKSAQAGTITFNVTNTGPEDEHEFVVIKSDLAPDALPTEADGSAAEDQLDVIDEIEPFEVGDTKQLKVDLAPGSYVLICNVVEEEDNETESHYKSGMRTAFTVQ